MSEAPETANGPDFRQGIITAELAGHAEQWDRLDIEGDPVKRDCAVSFWHGGRKLAMATVGRDRDSLRAEAEFERGLGA
jgi:hypothetical protein